MSSLIKLVRNLTEFFQSFLVILVIVLPAPLIGGLDAGTSFLIRALIILAAGLLFTQNCIFGLDSLRVEWPVVRFPICLFLWFILYALFQSAAGNLVFLKWLPGSIQSFETRDHAIQLIFYTIFFLLCLHFFSSRERVRFLSWLLAIETMFLIAVGYYQEMSGLERLRKIYGFYSPHNYMSFFSSFLNSNHYGGFLVLVCPLFLGSILYWSKKNQRSFQFNDKFVEVIFFGALLPIMAASIFFAGARAAFFLFIVLLILYVFLIASVGFRLRIFFFLVAFVLLFSIFLKQMKPEVLGQYGNLLTSGLNRFSILNDSLGVFYDYPVFGTGLGTYKWISKFYQSIDTESFWLTHVHNDFIELLTDTGIIGFLLFLIPLFLIVRRSWQSVSKSPSEWCRVFGLSSVLAICALGLLSLSEFYVRTPAVAILFIVHLAILIRCGTLYSQLQQNNPRMKLPARLAAFFLGVAILTFMGRYAYGQYVSTSILNKAELLKANRDIVDIDKAILISPDNPQAFVDLGDAFYYRAVKDSKEPPLDTLKKSIQAYAFAVKLAPTWSDAWFYLGNSEILSDDEKLGFRHLEKGLELSSHNRDNYLYVISHYLRQSDRALLKQRKVQYRHRAMDWLKKASKLTRPFTDEDYDYFGLGSQKLSPEDRKRMLSLLAEEKSS